MGKYGDWTRGEDEALLNILGGLEVARGILRGTVEVITKVVDLAVDTLTVPVDETQAIEDAVKIGDFDCVNDSITSANFPKPANGQKSERELVLFHFNNVMTPEEIVAKITEAGYELATIWDILGLAAKEPNLQKEFPIVALGSVWQGPSGHRRVPCLCSVGGDRNFGLSYLERGWRVSYRFLARRK